MDRYVNVDKLIWRVLNDNKYGTITKNVFVSLLQNADTEDVAPVVHAHWREYIPGEFCCSRCEYSALYDVSDNWDEDLVIVITDFCPGCGARMDEEVS